MKPLIIAHRGTSHFAPENTFAAFRRALEDGAEGLEFDVQLSNDEVPVVIHDFNLKRLAGRENFIRDMTAKELQKTDVGSWFNRRYKTCTAENFSAETVPTLAKLFEFLIEYRGLLYVELKFSDEPVEKAVEKVCEMIFESNFLPRVKLKSFNLKAIKYAKEHFPKIATVALFEPEFKTIFRKKTSIFDAAEAHLANEISLHYSLATRKTTEIAKARNLPVTIWTVDQTVWVKRAIDLGIEAIIANNPAPLLAEKQKIFNS